MTAKTKAPRTPKTPRQRAEEALAVAERKVVRLAEAHTKQKAITDALSRELDEARQRLAYVKRDPALPEQPTTGRTDQSGDTA